MISHINTVNICLNSMQNTLNILLQCFKSHSQQSVSSPKLNCFISFLKSVKKHVENSLECSLKTHMKHLTFKTNKNENTDYNDYVNKELNYECVDA